MKSSVATATVPPKEPARRTLTVQGKPQEKVQDDHDHFLWTYTEEPHRTRRQAIIKAHPEVCSALAIDCGFLPLSLPLFANKM